MSIRAGRREARGREISAGRRLLLDGPAVAVRVAEEAERVPRPAVAVLPLAVLDVPDGGDVDPAADELGTGGVDVRDTQLEALQRAGLHLGEALPDRDRAGRAGRGQLDDAEALAGGVIDVDDEAALVGV